MTLKFKKYTHKKPPVITGVKLTRYNFQKLLEHLSSEIIPCGEAKKSEPWRIWWNQDGKLNYGYINDIIFKNEDGVWGGLKADAFPQWYEEVK